MIIKSEKPTGGAVGFSEMEYIMKKLKRGIAFL